MNITIEQLEQMHDYPLQMQMPWGLIVDTNNFVQYHLSFIKHNPGKKWTAPYYERLCDFYVKVAT